MENTTTPKKQIKLKREIEKKTTTTTVTLWHLITVSVDEMEHDENPHREKLNQCVVH